MSTIVMAKQSKPYYGEKTKKKIVEDYFRDSVTMKELSELHGIFGSNTVASWLKKNGNLRPRKFSNIEVMNKPHSPIDEKEYRKKRYKFDYQYCMGLETYPVFFNQSGFSGTRQS